MQETETRHISSEESRENSFEGALHEPTPLHKGESVAHKFCVLHVVMLRLFFECEVTDESLLFSVCVFSDTAGQDALKNQSVYEKR